MTNERYLVSKKIQKLLCEDILNKNKNLEINDAVSIIGFSINQSDINKSLVEEKIDTIRKELEKNYLFINNIDKLEEMNSIFGINSDFELDLLTLSENVLEDMSRIRVDKLVEDSSDIDKVLEHRLEKGHTLFPKAIESAKYFYNNYISSRKINTNIYSKEELERYNSAKKSYSNSMNELSKLFDKVLKYNIDYFKNEDNKEEVIKDYKNILLLIKIMCITALSLRIICGNKNIDFGTAGHFDDIYVNKEGLKNTIKQLSISDLSNENNSDYLMNNLKSSLSPDFQHVFSSIYDNMSSSVVLPSMNKLFIKRMSVSSRYIHHVDQIMHMTYHVAEAFSTFIEQLTSKSLNDMMDANTINKITSSLKYLENEIELVNSDISSFRYTSDKYIQKDMNNIAIKF